MSNLKGFQQTEPLPHLLRPLGSVGIQASGAISGVIGAYIVMYPARKFICRIFYLAWLHFAFEVPAFVYFGLWILLQIVFAAFHVQGVAWWAHVAGFSMGASMALTGRVLGWVTPRRWD